MSAFEPKSAAISPSAVQKEMETTTTAIETVVSSSDQERPAQAPSSTNNGSSDGSDGSINSHTSSSSSSDSSQKVVPVAEPPVGVVEPHVNTDPLVKCRCGCVPKDMMSLFQMAELRVKMREAKKRKEMEASAQNLPTGRL